LTKESSIAKILQFSVIIRVQERLPAQSNPSHEQSTLKLLISGFNKKLPKKESRFTMWTLKIKLLISVPKVLRGNFLKNSRKEFDWYHQRKCALWFPSPAGLDVPYYGVDTGQDFVRIRKWMFQIFRIWNRNVRILKTKFIQFSIRLQIVILRRVLITIYPDNFTATVCPNNPYSELESEGAWKWMSCFPKTFSAQRNNSFANIQHMDLWARD